MYKLTHIQSYNVYELNGKKEKYRMHLLWPPHTIQLHCTVTRLTDNRSEIK